MAAPLLAARTRAIHCSVEAVAGCQRAATVTAEHVRAELLARRWRPVGKRGKSYVCPSCAEEVMCHPAEGPLMAYAGQRAIDRYTTDGEKRHAVTLFAEVAGTLDAECGQITVAKVGPWDPTDPLNCTTCAAFIAGHMPLPAEPQPALQPQPVQVPVQLELFTTAA